MLEASSVYSSFPVGRKIWVRCNGLCLTDYHGTMQLGVLTNDQGIPGVQGILPADIDNHIVGGSINNPVAPIAVTPSDLGTSMQDRYINALVQLQDFEFIPADTSKTYSDTSAYKNTENRTIKNCSGSSLIVRNSAYANFTAVPLPKGNGSITSIYTVYRSTPTSSTVDKQLLLRDTSDVQFVNARCGSAPSNALLFENFESYPANTTSPYSQISIPGWQNLAEITGSYTYTNRIFSSNKYAYVSPFGANIPTTSTWLVTKGINLNNTTTETLTFDTKQDFRMSNYTGTGVDVSSTLRVMYSTNYTGTGNPWAAGVTWTDFTGVTLSPGTTTGSAFPTSYTNSGNIDLSSISGTIYIAFKNEGADPSGTNSDHTSAWEIDNIKIIGN
jgi:hypothetical protein